MIPISDKGIIWPAYWLKARKKVQEGKVLEFRVFFSVLGD
jgi:hypothetical protein